MGFTTKQTNPVPWDEPIPAPASPKPTYPFILAPAMNLLVEVEAAGKSCPQLMKFLADVRAGGKYRTLLMLMLLQDFTEHGLHPGLINSAENLFEDQPDLLVPFFQETHRAPCWPE